MFGAALGAVVTALPMVQLFATSPFMALLVIFGGIAGGAAAGVDRCSTVTVKGEAVATAKAVGKGAGSGAYRELTSNRHKPR
jgi:hypothetical protein